MELSCLGVEDEREIGSFYGNMVNRDLHYDMDYLKIFARYLDAEPIYACFEDGQDGLMMPFFKRRVNDHFDLVSPWYYGGPIFSTEDRKRRSGLYRQFRSVFGRWCLENDIVSEFTRFNSILDNCFPEVDGPRTKCISMSVVVDLNRDMESIRADYKPRVGKNIRSARNKGLEVEVSTDTSDFPVFREIYLKTMKDIGADRYYHFDDRFFQDLCETFGSEMIIYFIKMDGIRISATIDIGRYGVMYDFLRGMYREFLKLNPSYLLVDRIIEETHERGFEYLCLGGGRSSKDDDKLFFFKSAFSRDHRPFCVFKGIYNQEVYKKLCAERNVRECRLSEAEFFPEYRMK